MPRLPVASPRHRKPDGAAGLRACPCLGAKSCLSFHGVLLTRRWPAASPLGLPPRRWDSQVFHSINAWELRAHFPTRKFDAIVWNHPHLGVEDFRLHRFLMAHFLHSAMECRAPAGTISVSLVQGQAQRWDLLGQAARVGLCEKHTSAFSPAAYPGYETRRNRTGNSFQNTQTQKHTGCVPPPPPPRARRALQVRSWLHLSPPSPLTSVEIAPHHKPPLTWMRGVPQTRYVK